MKKDIQWCGVKTLLVVYVVSDLEDTEWENKMNGKWNGAKKPPSANKHCL